MTFLPRENKGSFLKWSLYIAGMKRAESRFTEAQPPPAPGGTRTGSVCPSPSHHRARASCPTTDAHLSSSLLHTQQPELSKQPKARCQQLEQSRQRPKTLRLGDGHHRSLQRLCTDQHQLPRPPCKRPPRCGSSRAGARRVRAELLSFLELLPFQLRRRSAYSSRLSEAAGKSRVLFCPAQRGGRATDETAREQSPAEVLQGFLSRGFLCPPRSTAGR